MSEKAFQSRQVARHGGPAQRRRAQGGNRAAAAGAGYTIAHAGRQIRFGPVAFWITVGTVVIMAGWSVATGTYFAFRDDVLKGLIAREAAQQFAYEDRIADLRAQIDRTTSRQLLDQEQFEQKLDDIAHRQAALEARAAALSGLADPTPTGSLRAAAPKTPGKPFPLDAHPGRGAWLAPDRAVPGREAIKAAGLNVQLTRVEASLDRVERDQTAALHELEDSYESKAHRIRSVLAGLGLKRAEPEAASGGPFVPIGMPGAGGDGFAPALTRVNIARAQADELSRRLITVPLRKPITGALDVASPFGVRMDPFLHVAAMHTGIDFRGDIGDPVHATAAGTVTVAGWSGGYGKMVEINHGDGLATRYGHLSEIDVAVGDKVRIGQVVGRIGSTGRSTGPHLHYETRVNGEAVDPERFLTAGAKLFGG